MLRKQMNRKIRIACTLITVLAASFFSLYAGTAEELMAEAQSSSTQVKRYEINRENSLLSVSKIDAQDGMAWTVDLGTMKYQPTEESVLSYNPGFTLKFPETDSGITYSLGLDTSLLVKNSSTSGSISPNAGLVWEFDLGYVYDVDDITMARQLLSIETSYQTSLLEFQMNFIDALKALINQEINIESAQRSLDDSQKQLDKAVALKTVTEGTSKYSNLQNAIDSQTIALENLQDKLDIAKANFKTKYGIEYVRPEISETQIVDFESLEDGNSSVKLAWYKYQLALEAYRNKTETAKTLDALASLSGNVGIGTGSSDSLAASAGVKYSTSNGWTASGSVDLGWNISSSTFSPSVTLSGKYVPSNTDETDQIEIKELEYDKLTAQLDWENELSGYLDDAVDMRSSIRVLEGDIKKAQADVDYAEKLVQTEQAKLDLGLASQTDVDDAVFSQKKAETALECYYLDAISLNKKIALLQL